MKTNASNNQAPSQKTGKSWFSKTVAWLHLWPSLISSIIVIFVCLTGTIVVYCDEIIDFANREVLYVPEVKSERIPTEMLLEKLRAAYPDRGAPSYVVTYKDPARSVKFNSFSKKDGLSFIFMDPYTGEIMKEDKTIYFFFITAHLHNSLLLGEVGAWIVDISTIIFTIGLITGLVLWWPAKWTKSTRERSFTVKWKARFKRLNYDLHNVFGFYTLSIATVLAVTGLIIAFQPLSGMTISMFGGDPTHNWENVLTVHQPEEKMASMEPVINRYYEQYPDISAIQIGTYNLDKQGYYMLAAASKVALKNYIGTIHFVDKYTGAEINISEKGRLHEQIENTYWMLHMGTWLGWFGKLVTFIGGLVATSLPITGFLIWWGRRKKSKRKFTKQVNVKPVNRQRTQPIIASKN